MNFISNVTKILTNVEIDSISILKKSLFFKNSTSHKISLLTIFGWKFVYMRSKWYIVSNLVFGVVPECLCSYLRFSLLLPGSCSNQWLESWRTKSKSRDLNMTWCLSSCWIDCVNSTQQAGKPSTWFPPRDLLGNIPFKKNSTKPNKVKKKTTTS